MTLKNYNFIKYFQSALLSIELKGKTRYRVGQLYYIDVRSGCETITKKGIIKKVKYCPDYADTTFLTIELI